MRKAVLIYVAGAVILSTGSVASAARGGAQATGGPEGRLKPSPKVEGREIRPQIRRMAAGDTSVSISQTGAI